MSPAFEIDPVEVLTAGAVGEPGRRTFFVQARRGTDHVTLLCEKQQVGLLAEMLGELLERIDEDEIGDPAIDPALELSEPLEPDFRVGQMAVGYDPARDLVLLQCDEYLDEDDEDDDGGDLDLSADDDEFDGDRWRFWATREQARSLVRHARAVVASGRPVCRMCGGPIDGEGHFCPPSNGHREVTDLPGA